MTSVARPQYVCDAVMDRIIQAALDEDIGSGDVTSELTISTESTSGGVLTAKESGVIAGLEVATRVFRLLDSDVEIRWSIPDGSTILTGQEVGVISGPTRSILAGERLALNFIQRMSGIATQTARFVKAVAGNSAQILDTRKTAPGLRALDKWAVLFGGGQNHRVGLFDMILIKDNHIAAAGGIEGAIRAVSQNRDFRIEIETKTLEQVQDVVRLGGVDRILLDNMVFVEADGTVDTSLLEAAIKVVDGKFETEASGNVTLDTVARIATSGVDFISSGALTHSVTAFDVSLNLSSTKSK